MKQDVKMPIDEAEEFQVSEMFVSRTDKKGIIQSGNEVFARISGYSVQELLKKPHNIIRHVDMPKSVFKLFWSRIKADLPTFAYVKNRSKSGKHYWVIAAVFPNPEGYFSIRLKPTSELLKKVIPLYAAVLKLEKEKGIEEGEQYLLKQLELMGFGDYDKFMLFAMQEELAAKEEQSSNESIIDSADSVSKSPFRKLKGLREYASLANTEIQKTSHQLSGLQIKNKGFIEHAQKVKHSCTRLQYLASNMSITAHKFGKEGGSLAVVAASYQAATQRVQKGLDAFCSSLENVILELDRSLVDVLCLRMQIEMISFEIDEAERAIYTNEQNSNFTLEKRISDIGILLRTVHTYFVSSNESLVNYFKKIRGTRSLCRDISKILLNIDLIRTGGLIEGSRTDKVEKSFQPFMEELSKIITDVQEPIEEISSFLQTLDTGYDAAMTFTRRTEFYLSKAAHLHSVFLGKKNDESKAAPTEIVQNEAA